MNNRQSAAKGNAVRITALYERLSHDDEKSKVYKEMIIEVRPQTYSKS